MQIEQGSSARTLVFVLPFDVVLSCQTQLSESYPPAPPQPRLKLVECVLAGNRPLSGPVSGPSEQWKHKHKPRAHKDTHRPQSLSGAVVFRVNRCLSHNIFFLGVCPMHLKNPFILIIPFCCLCLFCFALFFFHTLRAVRVRKFCPAAFWNRPFHSLNQEPFVLGSE